MPPLALTATAAFLRSFLLSAFLAQVPESPQGYDNAWQWVAGAILVVAIALVTVLWRDNVRLNAKLQVDTEKQRDDWKLTSQTCSADFGKTSDALKVANDSTVIVIGKIDRLGAMQEKLSEQLDRNAEQLRTCSDTMGRLQPIMDRIQVRFARDEP